MERWYVYVVRTRGGALYTGVSTDVDRRFEEHSDGRGRGARAVRGKGPLELVFEREIGRRGLAQRVESRIKALTRERKEQLLRIDPDRETLLAMLSLDPVVSDRTSR
jgi:putative endonuclease